MFLILDDSKTILYLPRYRLEIKDQGELHKNLSKSKDFLILIFSQHMPKFK